MSHGTGFRPCARRSGLKSRESTRGAVGSTSSGSHTARPPRRTVVEAERAEVELEVPEELHEADDLVLQPVEDGVDEARHHLAVAEPEAAHEELELREPAPRHGAHERVACVLLDRQDLEPADAPVRADAHFQVERREPLVVPEEIGERPVRLLPAPPCRTRGARRAPSAPTRNPPPCRR